MVDKLRDRQIRATGNSAYAFFPWPANEQRLQRLFLVGLCFHDR
jgi:hypothetical protein